MYQEYYCVLILYILLFSVIYFVVHKLSVMHKLFAA